MNLGGLTTLAPYRPRNLVHVVFDNESLLSVGGFRPRPRPAATSPPSRRGGVPRTATVRTLEEFRAAFSAASRPAT
jgi:sulfopyruvate decarboxylase subunit beta